MIRKKEKEIICNFTAIIEYICQKFISKSIKENDPLLHKIKIKITPEVYELLENDGFDFEYYLKYINFEINNVVILPYKITDNVKIFDLNQKSKYNKEPLKKYNIVAHKNMSIIASNNLYELEKIKNIEILFLED